MMFTAWVIGTVVGAFGLGFFSKELDIDTQSSHYYSVILLLSVLWPIVLFLLALGALIVLAKWGAKVRQRWTSST